LVLDVANLSKLFQQGMKIALMLIPMSVFMNKITSRLTTSSEKEFSGYNFNGSRTL